MLSRLIGKIWPYAKGGCGVGDERLQYNHAISAARAQEYPMLQGTTYLDHAGTTLPSASFIDSVGWQQKRLLLANPHSALPTSPNLTQTMVHSTRLQVLELFHASPDHFDVVFVANATAAAKLVFDAFRDQEEGFDYYYHRHCHTSLVGGRELAQHHHCFSNADNKPYWWRGEAGTAEGQTNKRPELIAYPAQSNMNGHRLPLSWSASMRQDTTPQNTFVLLDVAAHIATTPIDLSDPNSAPDFLIMSFYKIFGFPNLGALLVRKSAAHMFNKRRYFGGGTTEMITCNDPWVARKTALCERVEDGTGPVHSILALNCAITVHQNMYGGLHQVSKHTTWLAQQMYDQLSSLRHSNGKPVCVIYKDPASTYGDPVSQGATIAFNVCAPDGRFVDMALVSNEAQARNIHIRAGGLCNPAGMAHALGFDDEEVQRSYDAGLRCGQGISGDGMPLGMVRVSFGACSTLDDIRVFKDFIQNCFVDRPVEKIESQSGLVKIRNTKAKILISSVRLMPNRERNQWTEKEGHFSCKLHKSLHWSS